MSVPYVDPRDPDTWLGAPQVERTVKKLGRVELAGSVLRNLAERNAFWALVFAGAAGLLGLKSRDLQHDLEWQLQAAAAGDVDEPPRDGLLRSIVRGWRTGRARAADLEGVPLPGDVDPSHVRILTPDEVERIAGASPVERGALRADPPLSLEVDGDIATLAAATAGDVAEHLTTSMRAAGIDPFDDSTWPPALREQLERSEGTLAEVVAVADQLEAIAGQHLTASEVDGLDVDEVRAELAADEHGLAHVLDDPARGEVPAGGCSSCGALTGHQLGCPDDVEPAADG